LNDPRYRPPNARLHAPQREPGSIVKAVVFGALVDISGTFLTGGLLTELYVGMQTAQGQSLETVVGRLQHLDPLAPLSLFLNIPGFLMSVLGGYVCAYIANRRSYNAAGILSAVLVGLSAVGVDTKQWKVMLLLNLLTLLAIFIGAWLYMRRMGAGAASAHNRSDPTDRR
jgi:hypothetical protein